MHRWFVVLAVAVAVSGCFDAGEVQSSDASSGDVGGVADAVGSDAGAGDAARSPCGGCSGETPVCLEETGTCVECLGDGDCGGESPVCDPAANACVECLPENEADWYPDGDGDGFGDGSVASTAACEQPEGMVDNADDCDDTEGAVNPEADEVCNGRDDDCDGGADEEVVPEECGKQAGVCEGATIAACSDEGGYAACGADKYGDDYVEADDEDWHCDGRDNDCDGEVDDICCAEDEETEVQGAGPQMKNTVNATVAAATEAASAGREFVLAWSLEDAIHLQYPGASGSKSHSPWGDRVVELEVAADGTGYLVAAILEKQVGDSTHTRVELFRFNSGLNYEKTLTEVDSREGGQVAGLTMTLDAPTAWVAYTRETALEKHDVVVASVDGGDGTITNGPTPVTRYRLQEPGAPAVALVGRTPTVAWWDANREQVHGVRMSGNTVASRFSAPTGPTDREENEPIELVATGGEAHLVYPFYDSADQTELTHLAVGPNETGVVMGGTALTGATERHGEPAVMPVDRSGDGETDHLLVAWEAGGRGIDVGRMSLDSPGAMDPRSINGRGTTSVPDLAVVGRKGLVVWNLPLFHGGSNEVVYRAPVSIDGVPVCRENGG